MNPILAMLWLCSDGSFFFNDQARGLRRRSLRGLSGTRRRSLVSDRDWSDGYADPSLDPWRAHRVGSGVRLPKERTLLERESRAAWQQ